MAPAFARTRPHPARTAITILIVDDDPDMRMLARHVLERGGISVAAEAEDGPESLVKFRELQPPPVPTVVLLDNQMPGLSGIEVAARILAELPAQLVVLFSAYLDDDLVRRAERLGVAACIPKSAALDLVSVIESLVAGSPQRD